MLQERVGLDDDNGVKEKLSDSRGILNKFCSCVSFPTNPGSY